MKSTAEYPSVSRSFVAFTEAQSEILGTIDQGDKRCKSVHKRTLACKLRDAPMAVASPRKARQGAMLRYGVRPEVNSVDRAINQGQLPCEKGATRIHKDILGAEITNKRWVRGRMDLLTVLIDIKESCDGSHESTYSRRQS